MIENKFQILKEKKKIKIRQSIDELSKLEHFKSDYEDLISRLKTLPDELSYNALLPLGSKAFIPGKLVRTNEIFVLLGDNWFVESSAKHAIDIAKRRVNVLNDSIQKVNWEIEDCNNQMKFTEEFSSGVQEIVEFENEEGHITTIKGPNITESNENSHFEDIKARKQAGESMISILDEMEKQEMEANNDENIPFDLNNNINDERSNDSIKCRSIRFSHSNIVASNKINSAIKNSQDNIILTPADIFQSTANNDSIVTPDHSHIVQETKHVKFSDKFDDKKVKNQQIQKNLLKKPQNSTSTPPPFTPKILERTNPNQIMDNNTVTKSINSRPISKFKSARSQL